MYLLNAILIQSKRVSTNVFRGKKWNRISSVLLCIPSLFLSLSLFFLLYYPYCREVRRSEPINYFLDVEKGWSSIRFSSRLEYITVLRMDLMLLLLLLCRNKKSQDICVSITGCILKNHVTTYIRLLINCLTTSFLYVNTKKPFSYLLIKLLGAIKRT